jgi:hypothetical protein
VTPVIKAPTDSESWEEIGWIGVYSGTVAFGAASILGEDFRVDSESSVRDGSPRGYEAVLVLQGTREDNEFPVEILRGDDRTIEAARMCFVTDVDELEGTWREIGRLELPDGQCVACDSFCLGPVYHFVFEVKPSSYVVEAFDFSYPEGDNDVLGFRIRLRHPAPERSRARAATTSTADNDAAASVGRDEDVGTNAKPLGLALNDLPSQR